MDAMRELAAVSAAFERDLAHADPTAPLADVDWTVSDLAAHLGGVYRWAARCIIEGVRPPRRSVPELTSSPLDWYRESRSMLLDTLDTADPEGCCYTFSRSDTSVRFWYRRQLHETVVHLWDLRSAGDPAAPAPAESSAEVSADGIDEFFDVFVGSSSVKARPDLGGVLRLEATDADRSWVLGSDWALLPAHPTPAATIAATTADLQLAVWNRRSAAPAGAVTASGDEGVIERFRRAPLR